LYASRAITGIPFAAKAEMTGAVTGGAGRAGVDERGGVGTFGAFDLELVGGRVVGVVTALEDGLGHAAGVAPPPPTGPEFPAAATGCAGLAASGAPLAANRAAAPTTTAMIVRPCTDDSGPKAARIPLRPSLPIEAARRIRMLPIRKLVIGVTLPDRYRLRLSHYDQCLSTEPELVA
jgi:hypothetical protein